MDIGETHHTRWFHPGREEKDGVPGSYRVDADGRVEVHVYETWDGEGSLAFVRDEGFPEVLLGEVFREAVTLVGCHDLGGKTGVTSQQDIRVIPEYVFEGDVYLTSEDDLHLTSLQLRLTDQEAWTNWEPFGIDTRRKPEGLESATAAFAAPDVREARVDVGVLRLVDDSYVHEDAMKHRTVFQARSRFEYVFDEPVPVRDAMSRYGYPLQVLLLTATGVMPGAISIRGTNPAWFTDADEAPRFSGEWVTMRRFHGGHRGLLPNSLTFLHRLEDFDFPYQLPRVLASVTRHRHAFERYAETLSDRGGGNQSRFVAMTQVIDSYDRSDHPGEKRTGQFKVSVSRLDEAANGFIASMLPGTESWAYYVGELRNIVLHGDARASSLVADPRPLLAAFEILTLLFEALALIGFGFSVERARALVEQRHPYWQRLKTVQENFPILVSLVDSR